MDAVMELMENYSIATIALIAMAVKELVEFWSWAKNRFDAWRKKENDKDDKEESIEDRLTKLEEHDTWQYDKITEMSESLEDIKELLVSSQQQQKEVDKAILRALIKSLADGILEKGEMSTLEFETFVALKDMYEFKGGNSYTKDVLVPKIMKLPVKD